MLQVRNTARRTRTYFDLPAFHAALDAERQVRGLSWRQLGAEAGVAPSTLTRMGHGRHPDVDGLSALLAWASLRASSPSAHHDGQASDRGRAIR